jgi:hypothetical protein
VKLHRRSVAQQFELERDFKGARRPPSFSPWSDDQMALRGLKRREFMLMA